MNGQRSWLDRIEQAGNALPHPVTLFALATLAVMLASAVASGAGWQVQKPALTAGAVPELLTASSLLGSDGLWWLARNLVGNFMAFPPLGIVLVGMLGIGIAERSGLLDALLTACAAGLRGPWLTPLTVFLGVMSSVGLDAGYVVLPPLAASLYAAAGRSPLTGIAAAFAGVSAGFSANLVPTALDPLLAGFTESGARFIDPDYRVAVTANWYLMIVSTVVLTTVGALTVRYWVEPRLDRVPVERREDAGVVAPDRGALIKTGWVAAALALVVAALIAVPGAPLNGQGDKFARWIEAIVPLIFVSFMVPGLAYGCFSGRFRSDRDVASALADTMAGMGPYIVLGFFAAQFIECFRYSGLGQMLAITGGQWLAGMDLPAALLIVLFMTIVMGGNLLIGSASAKYAFFAPVFVPMLMQVGLSPELTQAAYRIGDSITNVITPLNPYMVIVLAFVQRYAPGAGLGTVVSMMLPFSLTFALAWITLLLVWMATGLPLGPGGALAWPAG
ncbi:MAG: AbgT family transporter [Gammaproteobacteria bacterium]|nr:AbgT family transporter [Gammaproteobacteria bacterium]